MRVIIAGGGTGGHIYPALTIAEELERENPGAELLYVGTRTGLEADIVPRAGLRFSTINVRGLVGKSPLGAGSGVLAALRGVGESLAILRRFRPMAVVGTGGYVCGPVVLAAVLLRLPTLIQEQNVFPGSTNRWLSRWVDEVALPLPEAAQYFPRRARLVVTGNPVRRAVIDARREDGIRVLGLDPGRRTVLAFGGSRGARSVNNAINGLLGAFAARDDLQLVYVTGRDHHDAVLAAAGEAGIREEKSGNIKIVPYLYDVHHALAAADLFVGRAGAMTIAEITVRGLPAILVPFPLAAHNEQEYNARVLADHGAAVVIPDRELDPRRLGDVLFPLLGNAGALERMAAASRSLGRPEAASTIARHVLSLARGLTRRR